MAYKFNPFTGNFDNVGSGSTGSANIPELDTDPVSPSAEEAWVLRSGGASEGTGGTPRGLLLTLTYAGEIAGTYEFSYRTMAGTTVRTTLN